MHTTTPRHFWLGLSLILVLLFGWLIFIQATQPEPPPVVVDNSERYNYMYHHAKLVGLPIPEKLDFCGEPVPLHDPDVRERLDRELVINSYWYTQTVLSIKRNGRWEKTMKDILRKNQIPEDFYYLMVAESNIENARSYAGAQGFWQFMPGTGRNYGMQIDGSIDERNDPLKSCEKACRYLRDSYDKFSNWTLSAASYNAGPGNISYAMTTQGENSYYDLYLNTETARYVYRILAFKIIFQDLEKYGFKQLSDEDAYKPHDVREITVTSTIPDLVAFAKQQGTSYKMVRVLNPWILGRNLPVCCGKKYTVLVPANARPAKQTDTE